jgi:hypothetical protein
MFTEYCLDENSHKGIISHFGNLIEAKIANGTFLSTEVISHLTSHITLVGDHFGN